MAGGIVLTNGGGGVADEWHTGVGQVVAFNRPAMVKSWAGQQARGVVREMITVCQDGHDAGVAAVAAELNVRLVQHERAAGAVEAAARIAAHYGAVLAGTFERHPNARFAIILEEDLVWRESGGSDAAGPVSRQEECTDGLVAEDALEYFAGMAPVMDLDPSVYCVSAYNDNGLAHLAHDPSMPPPCRVAERT
ncbi:hypothetical protein T484DRAFT_1770560 [Baffinella frigidus]|nr:hypothetical protein T484DRAFT_1770560 [Cryptophyta sp. CCMP2293]